MQSRAEEDRARRRRIPALLVAGLGAAVLAAGIAMGWGWVPTREDRAADDAPPADVVPLVLVSAGGTATRSGVVVGRDGLIVTRATGVDQATEVWVLATGRAPVRAEVAGEDPSLGVVVLDPPAEVGRPAEATATPEVGDDVVVFTASGAEQAPLWWSASVSATDVEERLTDGTVRRQLIVLRPTGPGSSGAPAAADAPGSTTDPVDRTSGRDGVVYDERGRFVGLVVSQRTGSGEVVVARSRAIEPAVETVRSVPSIPGSRLAATTEPGG